MSYTGLNLNTNYTWLLPTWIKNYHKRQDLFKTDSKTKEKCDIKMVKYSA